VPVRKTPICGVAFLPRSSAYRCTPASIGHRLLAPGAFPNGHSQDVLRCSTPNEEAAGRRIYRLGTQPL